MKSAEKYYVTVYNSLKNFISNIVITNPKWIKAIKDEKNNNKDTKWIANLSKIELILSSYIPSKNFSVLRKFTRYHYKLTNKKINLLMLLPVVITN